MTEHNDELQRITEQLQNAGSKDVTITVTPDMDTTIDLIGKIVDIRERTYYENPQAIFNNGVDTAAFSIFKDVSKYISSGCTSDELVAINKIREEWGLPWNEFIKKIVYMWVHEAELNQLSKDSKAWIQLETFNTTDDNSKGDEQND